MLKKLGLLALCGASAFAMHAVELNVNDKDLEFGVAVDIGQFNDNVKPDSVFIGAKIIHADKKHSDINILGEISDYYEIGFLMKRNIADSGLVIGLGVKLNGTKHYGSVPLGAEIGYKLPFDSPIPLYLNASIYYAPEVLSMSDAKNFLEYRISMDIEVIQNGSVTVGYRNLNTNYKTGRGPNNTTTTTQASGDISYNSFAYVGFKFAF